MLGVTLRVISILVIGAGLIPSQSWGWGKVGHEVLAQGAGELTFSGTQFWSANSATLGHLTNVPDRVWKMPATYNYEKHNHYIQGDGYFKSPKDFVKIPHRYEDAVAGYGESHVRTNGTAPWRAQQLYNMALEELRAGHLDRGLELAGAMTHYLADLSQPLHVTTAYDGEKASDEGIHFFFESDNLNKAVKEELLNDVKAMAATLLRNPKYLAALQGRVQDVAFGEMDRSYPFIKTIFKNDRSYGRKDKGAERQLKLAKERMADGMATVAAILSQLWSEAGIADQGLTFAPTNPEFIKNDFANLSSQSLHDDNDGQHLDCER